MSVPVTVILLSDRVIPLSSTLLNSVLLLLVNLETIDPFTLKFKSLLIPSVDSSIPVLRSSDNNALLNTRLVVGPYPTT